MHENFFFLIKDFKSLFCSLKNIGCGKELKMKKRRKIVYAFHYYTKKCLPHATRLVKCCVEDKFPLALFKREKNSLWLTKTRSFERTRMTCFSLELSSTRSSYFQSLKKKYFIFEKTDFVRFASKV